MKDFLLPGFILHEPFPFICIEIFLAKEKEKNAEVSPSLLCLNLCRSGNGWWWVPITAPFIGGVLGAGIYKIMVEMHHPETSKRGEGLAKEESTPLGTQEHSGANVCV